MILRSTLLLALAAAGCTPGPQPNLNSRDAYERYLGALQVSRGVDPTAYHVLQRQLRDPAPLARIGALVALGRWGRADAVPAVAALVKDPDPEVRAQAVRTLSLLGSEEGVAPLIEALASDPVADVRRRAALDLVKFSIRPDVRRALVEAMKDPSAPVRYNAWQTFCTALGRPDLPRDADACREFLASMTQEHP